MCGLAGAASGYLSTSEIEVFEDLMIVSNLRGKTGAGVIVVNKGPKGYKVHGVKSLGSGIDVCQMDRFRQEARGNNFPSALVGHTRLPTKGGHTIENVHPHMCKNLSGVHNGTLYRVEGKSIPEGKSDSRALYEHIDQVGLKNALAEADGAYALVFMDYLDGTLNFIRNHQRPLYLAKVSWNGYKTLYWSSEAEFLALVLGRHKVKFELVNLPVNELWSIHVSMRGDFEVYKDVKAGVTAWPRVTTTPKVPLETKGEESTSVADSIPFSNPTRSSTLVTLPSKVGPEFSHLSSRTGEKETYVVKNGAVILKGHDNKQVSLSGDGETAGDKSEGDKASNELVAEAQQRRSEHLEEREEADVQVRSGEKSRSDMSQQGPKDRSHLRVVPPISPEEDAFNREMQAAIDWREQTEIAFDKLMESRYPDDPVDDLFDKAFTKQADNEDTGEKMLETEKGTYFLKSRVEKMCLDGCAYCGDAVDYSKDLAWLDRDQFMCEPCQGDQVALTMMYDFYPFAQIMTDWRDGKLKGVGKPPKAAWSDASDDVLTSTDPRTFH